MTISSIVLGHGTYLWTQAISWTDVMVCVIPRMSTSIVLWQTCQGRQVYCKLPMANAVFSHLLPRNTMWLVSSEHPHLFAEYSPGMSKDRLVTLYVNRLLNNPIEERASVRLNRERMERHFDINDTGDSTLTAMTLPHKRLSILISRIEVSVLIPRVFADNFIAFKDASNGKTYTNLSFPLLKPCNLSEIVGLKKEEESMQNKKVSKGGGGREQC